MKHKIKKNRLKIFIALSLMITCVFGIMFAANTFAYESANPITDTFDITNLLTGQYCQSVSIKEYTGINNETYKCIEVQHNTTSSNYISFGMYLKNDLNYDNNLNNSNYTLLCNYEYGYYNNNNVWTTYNSSSQYTTINLGNTNNSNYYQNRTRTYYYTTSDYGYNYKTAIYNIYDPNYELLSNQNIYFNFRLPTSTSSNQYCFRIYNVDIIPNINIYTQNYIDTYYGPLEDQYNQLLEDYEELETDYYQLNNDYTQLENDYNDLDEDYTQLESNYTDLQQDLNNLTQTIDNGLWSYTSGVVAFGTGYGATYPTYQDILNANIIKDFTFDCIQTYPTYTQQNNGISGNVYIVMGVLPDENTSNWNEVKYTPASLLNFNVNTNITDYIKITIDLTTTNSVYQNRILQINKSNIELMNYEITSQKLEGLYDYNASDYRVERIRIEWTKTTNNDYLYLVSTNLNYTNGYTLGYYDGLKAINYDNEVIIQEQQNQIQQLEQRIDRLETTIEAKNEQISNYARGQYGLNNLMWTIGSTPFESFKQIWSVEFLGVDIANFILGIITTFIGLYVIKKFFL